MNPHPPSTNGQCLQSVPFHVSRRDVLLLLFLGTWPVLIRFRALEVRNYGVLGVIDIFSIGNLSGQGRGGLFNRLEERIFAKLKVNACFDIVR